MVDKRTMHEPSIRIPLVARGPGLPAGRVVAGQVLTADVAPSILELCHAPPLAGIDGRSWVRLADGGDPAWRTAWLYEYDYEKPFPYTPNVRGIRTDRWKFIRYPHGDGSPDRHRPEMYDLVADPDERRNLAADPAHAATRADLERQFAALLEAAGRGPGHDPMPLDEGIGTALPDAKIR
jgi:N-acetylglucosamine-6-sulfatase